jgi:DNA-binding LytR/AlgR family response regulator
MSYNCLIVDDEQLARQLLEGYVKKVPGLELKGMCKTPLEAMEIMQNESVDIMLLDIQMPELTGIELLKTLKRKPATIFTTAYSEYALEGYQLDVLDYLVKPFSFDRFIQAINKAIHHLDLERKASAGHTERNAADSYVLLHADHKIYKVKHSEILYIEGLKEYVSYYTTERRIIVLQSLKALESSLPPDQFIRVHRSYIVPIDKIRLLDGNQVKIGDKLLPIGRSYRKLVMERVFNDNG